MLTAEVVQGYFLMGVCLGYLLGYQICSFFRNRDIKKHGLMIYDGDLYRREDCFKNALEAKKLEREKFFKKPWWKK